MGSSHDGHLLNTLLQGRLRGDFYDTVSRPKFPYMIPILSFNSLYSFLGIVFQCRGTHSRYLHGTWTTFCAPGRLCLTPIICSFVLLSDIFTLRIPIYDLILSLMMQRVLF